MNPEARTKVRISGTMIRIRICHTMWKIVIHAFNNKSNTIFLAVCVCLCALGTTCTRICTFAISPAGLGNRSALLGNLGSCRWNFRDFLSKIMPRHGPNVVVSMPFKHPVFSWTFLIFQFCSTYVYYSSIAEPEPEPLGAWLFWLEPEPNVGYFVFFKTFKKLGCWWRKQLFEPRVGAGSNQKRTGFETLTYSYSILYSTVQYTYIGISTVYRCICNNDFSSLQTWYA